MGQALRRSEKWFRRGLWLVALVFGGFLIGLGGAVMGDLPHVETRARLEDFMDPVARGRLEQAIRDAQRAGREAQSALEQAQLKQQVAQADHRVARESFANWVATRRATGAADQDAELVARTARVDALRQAERQAQAAVEAQQQAALDARQAEARAREQQAEGQAQARAALQRTQRLQELRVFGYRLALTLPLLGLAGWLYARHRHGPWWPFVWGFIFFALFAFFVELVPYLPSYGGYVRHGVGLVVTVVVGRQAIVALNRYLERQRQAEQLPDAQRRARMGDDLALARLAKSVCPGCERPVDLKDGQTDFCPHCGIGLYARCGHCGTRRSAFARFCPACGTAARVDGAAAPADPVGAPAPGGPTEGPA